MPKKPKNLVAGTWTVRNIECKDEYGTWHFLDHFHRTRHTWTFERTRPGKYRTFQGGRERATHGGESVTDMYFFKADYAELFIIRDDDRPRYLHDSRDDDRFRVVESGFFGLILYYLENVEYEPGDYYYRIVLRRRTVVVKLRETARRLFDRSLFRHSR